LTSFNSVAALLFCSGIGLLVLSGGGISGKLADGYLLEISIVLMTGFVGVVAVSCAWKQRFELSRVRPHSMQLHIATVWFLITVSLVIRFLTSLYFIDYSVQPTVEGHWSGLPVRLSDSIRVWCLWTIALSIVVCAALCNRLVIIIVGYFLIILLIFELVFGSIALMNESAYIFNFAIRDQTDVFSGTFVNRNNYAYFVATVLPFSLSCIFRRNNGRIVPKVIVTVVVVSTCLVSVVLSQSRAGILATLISLLVWLWFSLRPLKWSTRRLGVVMSLVISSIVLIVLAANPEALFRRFQALGSSNTRFEMIRAVFDLPLSHWLTGIGVGNIPIVLHQNLPMNVRSGYIDYLHNDYLQFVLEYGVVVSFVFICVIASGIRSAWPKELSRIQVGALCGLLGCTIGGLVDFTLHVHGIMLVFCFYLGVIFNRRLNASASATRR